MGNVLESGEDYNKKFLYFGECNFIVKILVIYCRGYIRNFLWIFLVIFLVLEKETENISSRVMSIRVLVEWIGNYRGF